MRVSMFRQGWWVLILFVAAFLASGAAFGAEPSVVKVGYIPIGDCLQLYVADDLGFFKEEGIIVEKKPMKGGAVIAPAVESGEVQVGWSNVVSIIIAHAKGFDFVFLTGGALESEAGHRVHSLLVRKDSAIKKVSDLIGKKVAINTLGNINELSMTALADANHVDIKKIELVEVPFPNMEAALQNKAVDAILAVEPFVTLSISHGTARYLVKSVHQSFGERFTIASWFAKKSWVDQNPKTAAAFVKAINKASRFISEHPEKVPDFLVANTKLTADLAGEITLPVFSVGLDKADLQRMVDLAARYGFIKKSFPADEIISKYAD